MTKKPKKPAKKTKRKKVCVWRSVYTTSAEMDTTCGRMLILSIAELSGMKVCGYCRKPLEVRNETAN